MFVGIKIKMKDTNTFDQHTKIRKYFFYINMCILRTRVYESAKHDITAFY